MEIELEKYFETNKESWNKKVDVHLGSELYNMEQFLLTGNSLKEIEIELLGDITGKSILHLQCHFGQDSISLAKLGAIVTAIDISDVAINKAKELNTIMGTDVNFIQTNIYDLQIVLKEKYDIVYTSYGTIVWLPDLMKWAEIISHFLKIDGKFIFVEFHPFLLMLDEEMKEFIYGYFNNGAVIENIQGTYADFESDIKQDIVTWNHSTGEIINSLIKNNIQILSFDEYDFSPYNCFKNLVEIAPSRYKLSTFKKNIPMVFTLVGKKNI